ncbi:MAG TPA: ABC transporter permease [Candidatus Acetothermia bacterium]|nr:ABC transporter permease [Candidatus Acetothermia bacterium]
MTLLRHLLRSRLGALGLILVFVVVSVAIFGPFITPYNPLAQDFTSSLQHPSWEHLMGTDVFGRDILSRVMSGAHISLLIGLIAVAIGFGFGVPIGLLSGFYGGWFDVLVQRVIDALMALPGVLLAIVIVSILGISLQNAMIAVGVSIIPVFARLMRSSVIAIKEEEFLEAARAIGVGQVRMLVKHVFLNACSPVLVQISYQYASSILWAAGLSFLGLGAQPPTPEWGAMLAGGRTYIITAPHVITFPGLAMMIAILGFNLLGEALRDVLDPRVTFYK